MPRAHGAGAPIAGREGRSLLSARVSLELEERSQVEANWLAALVRRPLPRLWPEMPGSEGWVLWRACVVVRRRRAQSRCRCDVAALVDRGVPELTQVLSSGGPGFMGVPVRLPP